MSTDIFDKLKINRKSLRTAVTKLVNSIDAVVKATPTDLVLLEENLSQLKIKSNALTDVDKELERSYP